MVFLFMVLAYLVVGTFIARSVYAHQMAALGNKPNSAKKALNNMQHGHSCYQNPVGIYYRPSRACDCSLETKWRELKAVARQDAPSNPYINLLFWPAKGFHQFLTGKHIEVEKPVHEEIERLEKELQIS